MEEIATPSTSTAATLPDEELFVLKKHFTASDIRLVVRSEIGRKQLVAFVAGDGDLSLHFLHGEPPDKPVMRLIPWFDDPSKRITCMCFDPSGSWLLIAGYDNSLFIIPALALVDTSSPVDHRWSTDDVTIFPPIAGAQGSAGHGAHPSAIVWWQSVVDCTHTAVVASDRGDIAFINLASGSQIGVTFIRSPIANLQICPDNTMDSVFLMITDASKAQWRLLLEQRSTCYCWPGDSAASNSDLSSSTGSADLEFNSRTAPTTRSRLQGLKQLSVEKLASLRQRIADKQLSVEKLTVLRQRLSDTRQKATSLGVNNGSGKQGLSVLLKETDALSSGSSNSSTNEEGTASSQKSNGNADTNFTSTGPKPEKLYSVGDTFLQLQHARGRHFLSGYYAPNSILSVHGTSLEVIPLFVHKLPSDSDDILLTDRFLFVVNADRTTLSVISCQLSECRLDGETIVFNRDALISSFTFPNEKIVATFKCTESNYRREEPKDSSAEHENAKETTKAAMKTPYIQQPLTKVFKPSPVEAPPVDSCVVVTTNAMYTIYLRCPATEVFLELVLQHQALERAERLALVFGLSLQQLLEHAGDLRLAAKDFPNAIALYKLSRCRHLKSVLKFAASGHPAELLSYVNLLFSTSGLDLTASEKIHLSNLAVMSYTEQVLRNPNARSVFKNFLRFLRENMFYDEVLAVNVAGQTGLWDVLQHLCSTRGLHIHVLEVLSKVLRAAATDMKSIEAHAPKLAPTADGGMWLCASDPSLQQALLVRPPLARYHLQAVINHLQSIDPESLARLAALYDPSAPSARPFLLRRLRRVRTTSESGSCSSANDPSDLLDANVNEEAVFPVDLLLQTFLLVMLQLASRRHTGPSYNPQLVHRPASPSQKDRSDEPSSIKVPLQPSALGAGFAHVALIRNGTVYTWGGAVLGCLGTGPTMSRYATPQPIGLFPSLLVEVQSVACGRQHTLALTNNGVYAWGSSQFGQLGIKSIAQVPSPRLVETLAQENIVAISAGQYHSLALTEDGRVYSWGWGVHGQLGHQSVEDEREPKVIKLLMQQAIIQISGGHGHTIALGVDGTVYTFGSNVFGQLGIGSSTKSTVPVKVSAITEPCVLVATGYFHNLAVSNNNRLYTWGSSPQVLRLQAQAQKKARLLQQQSIQAASAIAASAVAASAQPSSTQPPPPANLSAGDYNPPPPSPSHPQQSVTPDASSSTSSATSSSENSANSEHFETQPAFGSASQRESTATSGSGSGSETETRQALKARLTLDNIGKSPRTAPGSTNVAMFESLSSKAGSGPIGNTMTSEIDEGQAHLLPQRVDLTHVVGTVRQIACGCHHSALLSSEGNLYMWGRNLDGQVGNGSRKEVPIPAPVGCAPTVSMKQATAVGELSNVLPGNGLDRAHLQQVCCGCEFTVALEATGSGRVWAWGSNSHAQLGFPPVEDSKPLEGKLVMLKTSKRVIKLPHGMHNSYDIPREVAGLPVPTFSYPGNDSQAKSEAEGGNSENAVLMPLASLEDPPYGLLTLHVALQRFYGFFDAKQLMAKCVELENYQAAARLAALDRRYHVALAFQLRALAQTTGSGSHTSSNDDDDVHVKNDKNASRSNLGCSKNNSKLKREQLITDTEAVPSEKEKEKGKEADPCLVHVPINSSCSSADVSPRRHVRGRLLIDQGRSSSAGSTPDSTRSSVVGDDAEMHTFSIQGGLEQMSEGGRTLSSPDSGVTHPTDSPAHQPSSLDVPSISQGSAAGTKSLDDLIVTSETREETTDKNSLSCGKNDSSDRKEEEKSSIHLIISSSVEEEKIKEANKNEDKVDSEKPSGTCNLVEEASALVEYYVSLMEEDSHAMMSQLLQQGFEFWLSHALPVEQLENLLLRHLPKFCYSLGLLLFCHGSSLPGASEDQQGSEPALLHQLSTRFCLQLCSVLLGHINQRKPHPEYMEALAKTAAAQGLNGCSTSLGPNSSPEHQMEALLAGLRGMRAVGMSTNSQPYITLTQEDLRGCGLTNSERLLVFSCGHHYGSDTFEQTVLPELELALSQLAVPLPGTARLLKGAFRGGTPSLQLACPRCVISHIQAQVLA